MADVAGEAAGHDPLAVGQTGRGREGHVVVEQDLIELRNRPEKPTSESQPEVAGRSKLSNIWVFEQLIRI